jgi:hypothetical protein
VFTDKRSLKEILNRKLIGRGIIPTNIRLQRFDEELIQVESVTVILQSGTKAVRSCKAIQHYGKATASN